jgi:hypothetical protein
MIRNDIPLLEKKFLTYEEFGSIVGVTGHTVDLWVRNGYLKAARFSPRCVMIPRTELERYERGEMMEPPGPKQDKQPEGSRFILGLNGLPVRAAMSPYEGVVCRRKCGKPGPGDELRPAPTFPGNPGRPSSGAAFFPRFP